MSTSTSIQYISDGKDARDSSLVSVESFRFTGEIEAGDVVSFNSDIADLIERLQTVIRLDHLNDISVSGLVGVAMESSADAVAESRSTIKVAVKGYVPSCRVAAAVDEGDYLVASTAAQSTLMTLVDADAQDVVAVALADADGGYAPVLLKGRFV